MSGIARRSCSALLIGNELLSGKTRDINGHHLAKLCSTFGLACREMRTVPDEYAAISRHVREMSQTFDYVFTSGGVGPTHDDITYEAIAKAFNIPLEYHKSTLNRMQHYFDSIGKPLNEARKRMALFPRNCQVYYTSPAVTDEMKMSELADPSIITPKTIENVANQTTANISPVVWTPVVMVGNVHMLPGIPSLFAHLSSHYFQNALSGLSSPLFRQKYGTTMHEGDLAQHLSRVQHEFDGSVMIGSYPRWNGPSATDDQSSPVRVVISFDSEDESALKACIERVKREIPLVLIAD